MYEGNSLHIYLEIYLVLKLQEDLTVVQEVFEGPLIIDGTP